MMLRGVNKLNMIGMAMLFLPIVMVKVMALSMGLAGPAGASASTATVAPPPLAGPSRGREILTPAQRALATRAEELHAEPFAPSPLLYGGYTLPTTVEQQSPANTYSVQMIMAMREGNIAVINNARYAVGDYLAGGDYLILSIDSDVRIVVVRHEPTGREFILRVR